MASREQIQEIANRGLQDRLSPEKRQKFDELVNRGIITLPGQQPDKTPVLPGIVSGLVSEGAKQEFPILPEGPVAGIASGVLKTVGGIGQALAKAGELRLIPGMPAPFPAGTEQRVTDVFAKPISTIEQRFGEKPGFTTSELATQVAPFLAAPNIGGRSLASKIAGGGFTGGLFGSIGFRPEATGAERTAARGKASLQTGALGALAPPVIQAGRRAFSPVAAAIETRVTSPLYKKSSDLLNKLGIKGGTIGEKTGSISLLSIEEQLRRSGSPAVVEAVNERNDSLIQLFRTIRKRVTGGKVVKPFNVGVRIWRGGRKIVDDMVENRKAIAAADFGDVERVAGNSPLFSMNNTQSVLAKFSSEATAGSEAALKSTKTALNRLTKQLEASNGKLSARQMEQYLSDYSELTVGKGKLFTDIGDRSFRSKIGKDIVRALESDLDDAVAASGGQGNVASLIRKARENYKINSKPIDEVNASLLGQLINKDKAVPEDIANAILTKGMGAKRAASEVRSMMTTLDIYSPDTAKLVRGFKIQSALDKAIEKTAADPIGLIKFDGNKMFDELGGVQGIKAFFPKTAEFNRVNEAMKALEIIGSKSNALVSGGRSTLTSIESSAATAASRDPTFLALNATRMLNPIIMRKALLSPIGQEKLIKIAKGLSDPSRAQSATIAAINYIRENFSEE